MHYFSLYFVTTHLHVLGPFAADHQEANCTVWHFTFKVTVGGPGPPSHFISKNSTIATLYTWPPDDGLQMGLKHVLA
jgi:hypothetical protein